MQRQSSKSKGSKQSSSRSNKSDSATGFDHDEMGMTQERQRVIQASLFKMLGQADSAGPGDEKKVGDAFAAASADHWIQWSSWHFFFYLVKN